VEPPLFYLPSFLDSNLFTMIARNKTTNSDPDSVAFEALVKAVRPDLLRYCARMVGSAADAEDVVQDALTRAFHAFPATSSADNLRGWLFRIAHNKAIDHLRRFRNEPLEYLDEYLPGVEIDQPLEEKELVSVALSVFLKLTPKQRSCVILKDVLEYSLAEISDLLDASVPDIKAALHRGRTRVREIAKSMDPNAPVALDPVEKAQLEQYVERFNARDFDALRAMLAEDVRLDLVNRLKRRGRAEVGLYFTNYDSIDDWRLSVGVVEDRPAILVYASEEASSPLYFIFLTWDGPRLSHIRDFRYARHIMSEVRYSLL
jgi:RNA polymerase sigma-70 factor, ECF subfamily